MPTPSERDMRDERAPSQRDERLRRYWDKHADNYDQQMGFFDRHLFGDTRDWVCSQAAGEVLEVAIGTGLNLPHYPRLLVYWTYDRSPARLGRGDRRDALIAAAHRGLVWLSSGMRPAGHRGGEWLKRGLPSS